MMRLSRPAAAAVVMVMLAAGAVACGEQDAQITFDGSVVDPPPADRVDEALDSPEGSTVPDGSSVQEDSSVSDGSNAGDLDGVLPPLTIGATEVVPDQIAGFGVNAEPRVWGSDGSAVKPSIDMMVQDLGANIFRLGINRGESNWEEENDDADPNHLDWAVYDGIFAADDFSDLYDYTRYLNDLGVGDIELSAHGLLPGWLGGTELPDEMEPEFVETMVAFLLYTTTRTDDPRPQFRWFSPWNETDLGPPEGISMDPDQQVRVAELLVDAMRSYPELDGIDLVMPESISEDASREVRQSTSDRLLESVTAFSSHRYGGASDSAGFSGADPPQWLTEFNAWVSTCFDTEWQQGLDMAANAVSALRDGFTAALVWNDFDGPHIHQDDEWQTFGIFGATHPDVGCGLDGALGDDVLDAITYEPKETYDAFWHISRFVLRGATRLTLGSDGATAVAFENVDGSVVVVGVNGGADSSVAFAFDQPEAPQGLVLITSTESQRRSTTGEALDVLEGVVAVDVPARSVFTLVSPGSGAVGVEGAGG